MYKAKSGEKLDTALAKAGGMLTLPPTGAIPNDALVATCDGCGAQVWLDPALKGALGKNENTHRTFCLQCLKVRKVI